jgi:CheY-like chemotaxis protein
MAEAGERTMRLLFVEDNIDFATEVDRALSAIQDCDEVIWVRSRDAALARLASESFDLVILDRKLPTADDVLDDHPDHGWAVFQSIRSQSSGTPVWFLTGTEDPDFAVDINNNFGRSVDLHGDGVAEQMYQVFWKRRMNDCLRKVREFSAKRKTLERIAITAEPTNIALNAEECRAIRCFGHRHHATLILVTSLNGGMSNSRVLKIVAKAADGRVLVTAAAKVSSLAETRAEAERYHAEISRLSPGGFPQLAATVDVGCGNTGGIFYGMIGENVESLFNRIASSDANVPGIPAEIRGILAPWYQGRHVEQVQVAQIRRRFIRDTVLHERRAELAEIDTTAIEGRVISVAVCCQHRDMHCANVVFDGRGHAMLIDFGDTGSSYASVDPITLELSTVFHSQHSTLPTGWPDEPTMAFWTDVNQFTEGCQFAPFIVACREWAVAEAASTDEVVAVAYAYAMRQLKYADTDKSLARALIRACINYFNNAPP